MANNTNSTNIIPINTSKDISVYVPFGGESVDLGEEAMVPAPEYLSLQYAIGLPAQRPKLDGNGHEVYDEDTGEQVVENLYYAGFFTQCGVDKNLDEAMKKNGIPWIDIVHGNGEVVRHWMIDKPSVFLMAKGIPSNANSNGQYGIVYQWRQKRNSTKSETVFYAQVIIRNLLPDYQKPFVLTVKSTQTGDILNAIRKQYKVLAKARELIRQTGRDIALPLWTYSFMLGASKKQVQRGEEGASKTIFPIISGILDEIAPAYLQKHEVPTEYVDLFKEYSEESARWAQNLAQRIASGTEPQEPWQQSNNSGDDPKLHKAPF